jgi:DNA-directed RNA polymerase specialized sigma24 family protein
MRLLSAPVPLHSECDLRAGEQHGRIDDVEKFTNDVISKYLAATPGGYLRQEVREELLGQLFVVAVRCAEEYDPHKGIGFRTYVFRTCWNRITDWYRKEKGDRRYAPRPPQESLDERHEQIGDAREVAGDLPSVDAIDVTGLSPESVMTLRKIVGPMLELGLTLEQLEEAYGWTRRELNNRLTQLRRELVLRDPNIAAWRIYYVRLHEREKLAKQQKKEAAAA